METSTADPRFARNYGFINEDEQRAILEAHIAIAGVGGDGFQLGLKLAQMGVQTFDIADPEVFEPENSNRVPGATTKTYGRKKADVFRENVLSIKPDADVRIFEDGVTEDNVGAFMGRATLVFDESELTYLQIGTAIAREARRRHIPDIMVMNIGYAAQVTSFHPDSKFTFEKMMGIPEGMSLNEVKSLTVNFERCLPYIPKYADMRSLTAVKEGASLPSIAQGVDVASAIGSNEAFLHMVSKVNNHRRQPIWSPRIKYMDSYDGTSGVARFPRFSYYRHAIHALGRDSLGLNPKASYTADDRARRQGKHSF